jgi:hypothetical protein
MDACVFLLDNSNGLRAKYISDALDPYFVEEVRKNRKDIYDQLEFGNIKDL